MMMKSASSTRTPTTTEMDSAVTRSTLGRGHQKAVKQQHQRGKENRGAREIQRPARTFGALLPEPRDDEPGGRGSQG